MQTNPYINAALATAYISGIALFLGSVVDTAPFENTVLAPIVMLSLLVLSVSIMAILFFYKPVTLLLDGHRQEALIFLAKTIISFAVLTALLAGTALIITQI